MKRNGIIYPNTPFFRKYAGKLIVPAGVDGEAMYLELALGSEVSFGLFLAEPMKEQFDLLLDDVKLTQETDFTLDDVGVLSKDMAEQIADFFPTLPLLAGYYAYMINLTEGSVAAGEHTLTAVVDGKSVSTTFTVE